jgi:nitroreductase
MDLTKPTPREIALTDEVKSLRKPGHPIAPLLLNRWSPRAMTGEPLTEAELMALFEAARWAPSCNNAQPWRFVYARRDTAHWPLFVGLLVEANRIWAQQAAVLMVVISRKNFEYNDKPNRTHAFDAGAAWENLALEATRRELVTHGMAGFDYHRARTELRVPENFEVMAMVAIGRRGKREDLPPRAAAMEQPNDRRPLAEIVHEGPFAPPVA